MRDVLAASTPTPSCRSRSDVLREYREYERVGDHAGRRRREADGSPRYVRQHRRAPARRSAHRAGGVPFYVMKSNGGVLSADEVVHQPITTVLSGPAAGALGAALIAARGRLRPGAHLRRRRHLDRRVRRPRRRADAHDRGHGRRLPEQDPDDRHRHGRRGRRLGRLDLARGHAQGRAALGRRRPGSALLRPGRHRADRHRRRTSCSAGSRRTCSAARSRWTSRPPAPGCATWPAGSASTWSVRATGILEISAWNQANALRQVTVQRGLDVRDFTLATFGGSGSLLLCRLVDILGLAGVLVPRDPGNLSAFGLLTVDVRNDYVRTAVAGTTRPRPRALAAHLRRPAGPGGAAASTARASRATDQRFVRTRRPALLRPGLRGPGADARRSGRRRAGPTAVADAFHDAHEQLYGYASATIPASRSSGSTCGSPGSARSRGPRPRESARRDGGPDRARPGHRPVFFDAGGLGRHAGLLAAGPGAPGDVRRRPRRDRGVRLDGAAAPRASGPPSTASATCVRRARTVMSTVDPRRPGLVRSSRARSRRSRPRSRPRSAAPRARR